MGSAPIGSSEKSFSEYFDLRKLCSNLTMAILAFLITLESTYRVKVDKAHKDWTIYKIGKRSVKHKTFQIKSYTVWNSYVFLRIIHQPVDTKTQTLTIGMYLFIARFTCSSKLQYS